MDNDVLTRLARSVASGSRRTVLAGLTALGVSAAALPDSDAKKSKGKQSKKKQTFCLDGQQVKAKQSKKKQRLRDQGATKGKCGSTPPNCTPSCPAGGACGADDGCGVVCGCAAGSICAEGVCEPCTITCTGTALACGALLQTDLTNAADGDKLYLCPGRYTPAAAPGFTFTRAINVYGAGSGDDPAVDTIIEEPGSGALRRPRDEPYRDARGRGAGPTRRGAAAHRARRLNTRLHAGRKRHSPTPWAPMTAANTPISGNAITGTGGIPIKSSGNATRDAAIPVTGAIASDSTPSGGDICGVTGAHDLGNHPDRGAACGKGLPANGAPGPAARRQAEATPRQRLRANCPNTPTNVHIVLTRRRSQTIPCRAIIPSAL